MISKLEPISRIEKQVVVKLVTVGINAGDNVVIIFLEFVGHRFAPGVDFFLPQSTHKTHMPSGCFAERQVRRSREVLFEKQILI
jgi:hypothetical protein